MKKYSKLGLIWGIILLLFILVGSGLNKKWDGKSDIRIGVVTDKSLEIVSISPERNMTNILSVEGDSMVWIPEGMGWYRADRIKRILDQEGKRELASKIMFYNFGFDPGSIVFSDGEYSWNNAWDLIKRLGWLGWIQLKAGNQRMIENREEIVGDLDSQFQQVNSIVPRDFSANDIVNEDIKISIYNASNSNNFGGFISNRLEWSGMTVVSVENASDAIDYCQINVSNQEINKSKSLSLMKKVFKCTETIDKNLQANEVELYLGEGLSSMVKYSNYVRSF